MRQPRVPSWNGLAALRRERSALAALGFVLLLAQLLLSGLSQGAMAAERLAARDLALICHTLDRANAVQPAGAPVEPDRSCPCLAGVCLVSSAALVPAGDDAALPSAAVVAPPAPPRWADAPAPRRPIDLFARASRGPPRPI